MTKHRVMFCLSRNQVPNLFLDNINVKLAVDLMVCGYYITHVGKGECTSS